MGLSIHTTPAMLSIKTYPGKFDMKVVDAKLEQKQRHAEMNIKTVQPMVLIDQYQCFAEAGLKNNSDFMKEQANKGYSQIMKYTAKVARDGDSMARIGRRANIMINIIKQEAMKTYDFNMTSMPKSRPRISMTGGTLDIQFENRNGPGEINGVSGNYTPGHINYNYTPSTVDIRVESYGSVDIEYFAEG